MPADSDEPRQSHNLDTAQRDNARLTTRYTTVRLRITEINGRKALAKYIGHMVAREYPRTLVRRHRDVVDIVHAQQRRRRVPREGACSHKRLQRNAEDDVAQRLTASLRKKAESEEFSKFIQDVLFNKANAQIHERLEKIVPIRRVEIWKTELKEDFDTDKAGEQPEGEAGAVKEPSEEKAE